MHSRTEPSFLRFLGRNSASNDDLFRWILVMSLIGLAGLMLWDYGFVHFILRNDISYISSIILVLFGVCSAFCAWAIFRLSDVLS